MAQQCLWINRWKRWIWSQYWVCMYGGLPLYSYTLIKSDVLCTSQQSSQQVHDTATACIILFSSTAPLYPYSLVACWVLGVRIAHWWLVRPGGVLVDPWDLGWIAQSGGFGGSNPGFGPPKWSNNRPKWSHPDRPRLTPARYHISRDITAHPNTPVWGSPPSRWCEQ